MDLSCLEFSKNDLKRNIKIPENVDEKLSEAIGIVIGDGHVQTRKDGYKIYVSGHKTDDKNYIYNYVIPLFKELFNVSSHIWKRNKNDLTVSFHSKALAFFFRKIVKVPSNKNNVEMPELIINSDIGNKVAFLRGLADTDFSYTFKKKYKELHYYPVIHGAFSSKRLVDGIYKIILSLGFESYITKYSYFDRRTNKKGDIYHIFISGKEQFEKWFKVIGSNNLKHITRYKTWREFGFCPPLTNLDDRKKFLMKILNPLSFYNGREEI